MKSCRAISKLILFAILCLIVVPPQVLMLACHRGRFSYFIPMIFHKGTCLIFQIKVTIENKDLSLKKPAIYISNHLSYLDIPVIGSILKASFVAKEDVSGWPVFGFLSKLQQTIFISRNKESAANGKNALSAALSSGKSLILFPEGTSTDGQEVLPFKSSLFSVIMDPENKHAPLVPFTLKIMQVDNQNDLSQTVRDLYAWHIKMDTPLGQHLWMFAQSKGAIIRVKFHPSLDVHSFSDRKELAKACHEAVSMGLID